MQPSTQDADSGEIRDFTQNGWHVSINSRAPALGFSLPQRLTAEREGARLKLLVDRWQSVSTGAMTKTMLVRAGQAQPDAAHRRPRPDGYHELQTVFQLIDLCDRIEITVREDGAITRPHGPAGVPEDEDLVVRAARALQAVSGTRLGAEISIKKRIPLGGGLGGGSSDAATTLVALNQMWEFGLYIGADRGNWRHFRR